MSEQKKINEVQTIYISSDAYTGKVTTCFTHKGPVT